MFEEVLVDQNKHWQGKSYDAGITRNIFDKTASYMENDFIISVCGVRRAGKSTLIKQIINHLIQNKEIDPRNILFLNLEDPVFNYYKEDVNYLETVYQDFLKLQNPQGKIYLFLDEVQFFTDWEVFVKSKYEKKEIKIVVTGSNSRLLSTELSTLLSGRTLLLNVYPFSFKEILKANDIDPGDNVRLIAQKPLVKRLFDEYLLFGGFPQVVFEQSTEIKKEILKNYYRNIFYNDIVPRFEIKKSQVAEKLLYYLLSNISSSFSYNNLSRIVSLSDKTVKEYTGYFSQSLLMFWVDRFSPSVGKQIGSPKKAYSIDNGLVNAIAFKLSENLGPMFENLVAVELLRREESFFYYITTNNKEVDFFVPRSGEQLIQVCYELKTAKTHQRELDALQQAMKDIDVPEGLLITLDEEKEINDGDRHIKIIPAWKYFSLS